MQQRPPLPDVSFVFRSKSAVDCLQLCDFSFARVMSDGKANSPQQPRYLPEEERVG